MKNTISLIDSTNFSYFRRKDLRRFLSMRGFNVVDACVDDASPNGILCFSSTKECLAYLDKFNFLNSICLVYCHEPRFDLGSLNYFQHNGCSIHVMNCYTDDVYLNMFHDLREDHVLSLNDCYRKIKYKAKFYSRQIIQLASYHQWMLDQRFEFDLIAFRNKIARSGLSISSFSLYGRGWPRGLNVSGNSREGDWVNSKKYLMNNYFFNICLENTNANNYVTEKLWDSISNLNVPIYAGYPGVRDFLPEHSYFDATSFERLSEIFEAISMISKSNWIDMMYACASSISHLDGLFLQYVKMARFNALSDKLRLISQ